MPRLLLVEDNEMNRNMLSRRLMRHGYEVVTAADGLEAVEVAGRVEPEVILMDLSLPEMDGWDATRALRAERKTASIPIIALTAHAMSEDRQRALDAGCSEFVSKPVDLPTLIKKIACLVGHSVPAKAAPVIECAAPINRQLLHDMNNHLGVIAGFLEIVLDDTPPEDKRRVDLLNIQTTVAQAMTLLRKAPTADSGRAEVAATAPRFEPR